jgi:hypothetical protein
MITAMTAPLSVWGSGTAAGMSDFGYGRSRLF